MSKNTDTLTALLGFDPSKKARLSSDLFNDVKKDFETKRIEAAKEKARTAITAAMLLQEQMAKSEKEFKQAQEKFEKELGKLVNEIKSQLDGTPASAEETVTEAPAPVEGA